MKKTILFILLLCSALTGCGYGTDVESQAYVIAVGIDKGQNFPLKVSFVFANPGGSNSQEGGAPSAPKPDIVTVEGPTVFSAVRKLDSIKSKKINLSHTKIVVFSQDKAKEGIRDYLSGFASSKDFRPNTYVCVAADSAENYLRSVKPSHETFIEKYFDNMMQKVAEDKVNEAYLYYLYYNVTEDFSGSLVPLAGVNFNKTNGKKSHPGDDFSYEAQAGQILRSGKNPAEVLGCAVFKNDKMIGTMGSFHTDLARILRNEFYPRNYSIAYGSNTDFVTIRLLQQTKPDTKTKIQKSDVKITIRVPVSIEYIDAGKIEGNEARSKEFCRHLEQILNSEAKKLVEESQTKHNCDILGLGNLLKKHFYDMENWRAFNWEEKYSRAKINVSFDVMYADFEEAN